MNRRLSKEAWQMFGPWALVTSAAALALAMPWDWQPAGTFSHPVEITFALVLFLGFPLLAGLPIGYEFQYQTLPGLLASPLDRRRVWREKFVITVAAVIAPAIFCAFRARENHLDLGAAVLIAAWITALAASAMFWTLFAKSTMGGLALNLCVQWLIFAAWMYLQSKLGAHGVFPPRVQDAAIVLLLVYAVAMVWLGRRALIRFQAIEGSPAADPLSEISAHFVPRAAAEWFRCRPKGVVLNLIKKELRLLRPVWTLAALNVLAWTLLAALGTDPGYHPLRSAKGMLIVASLAVTLALSPLIAVLSGALSLGEEKNLGTDAWHMTLPAPAWLQWMVKLGIALVAGTIFAGALPPLAMGARRWFVGRPPGMRPPEELWIWPVVFAAVTLAAFWISTLVKGTVRAALCVFPALFLFGATYSLAFDSGYKFAAWAQTLTDRILLWLDPFKLIYMPYPFLPYWESWRPWSATFITIGLPVLVAAAPLVAFILAQSYRRFRGQAEGTNRRLVQSLLVVAAMIFVCGAALGDFAGLIRRSNIQVFHFFQETNAAIMKIEAGKTFAAGTPPVQLTAEELKQAAPMSEATRHWLGNGTVTVGSAPAPSDWKGIRKLTGRLAGMFDVHRTANLPASSYAASMRLGNGLTCTIVNQPQTVLPGHRGPAAFVTAGCQ